MPPSPSPPPSSQLPPPQPAIPILASSLLDLEIKQRAKFGGGRISSGCDAIDEILGGGFERGIVVGISCDGGSEEGIMISLQALTSLLLTSLTTNSTSPQSSPPQPIASIIDTTGSFPLPLLARILKSKLISSRAIANNNQPLSNKLSPLEEKSIDDDVHKCLEKVSISRVFDIEGLWEVLGEVDSPFPPQASLPQTSAAQSVKTIREIVDSQESEPEGEEEEEEDEDEDGLSPYSLAQKHQPPQPKPQLQRQSENKDEEGIQILIINNLAQIINELFSRKERTDAHQLLTSLSRSLHILSTSHNILTILHNTTTPSKPPFTTQQPQPHQTPHLHHQPNQPPPPPHHNPPSLFPSNPHKPSLGKIFTPFPTLHLFLSSLPKSKSDAEKLYAHDISLGALSALDVKYCVVVEVVGDESADLEGREGGGGKDGRGKERRVGFGGREGRWTAVEVREDGLALQGIFQDEDEDGRRKMGKSDGWRMDIDFGGTKESRVGMGVGNVAKIYGFGGRRV